GRYSVPGVAGANGGGFHASGAESRPDTGATGVHRRPRRIRGWRGIPLARLLLGLDRPAGAWRPRARSPEAAADAVSDVCGGPAGARGGMENATRVRATVASIGDVAGDLGARPAAAERKP